jgi:hypothetical protein
LLPLQEGEGFHSCSKVGAHQRHKEEGLRGGVTRA